MVQVAIHIPLEEQMKKLHLFVLAVGILNAVVLPTAHATDRVGFVASDTDTVVNRYSDADYRRERRAYRHNHRGDYSFYRSVAGEADPWWPGSGFCSYGSYVACVYSGTVCWQRCY